MHEHTHVAFALEASLKIKETGGGQQLLQCLLGNVGQRTQHVEMLGQLIGPAVLIRQPPASLRTSAAARSLGDSQTGQHGSAFLLS